MQLARSALLAMGGVLLCLLLSLSIGVNGQQFPPYPLLLHVSDAANMDEVLANARLLPANRAPSLQSLCVFFVFNLGGGTRRNYLKLTPEAPVSVLVNSGATSLVAAPSGYYQSEMASLVSAYPQVEFLVCNNSINYLQIPTSSLPKFAKVVLSASFHFRSCLYLPSDVCCVGCYLYMHIRCQLEFILWPSIRPRASTTSNLDSSQLHCTFERRRTVQ